MGGFLQRVMNSLSLKKRTKELARSRTRRLLRVEPLEGRSLMALDLAVISGTAFVDVNSNSSFDSGTDTVVGGATVELYRDTNSNGTFNSGTDTLVGTTTTNATTGVYSFASTNAGGTLAADSLTSGNYFVRQLPISSFNPPSTPSLVTVTNNDRLGTTIQSIDPFNVTAQTVQANAGTPTATSSIAATEVVGGERDIRATFTSGLSNLDVAVVPGSSLFTFSSGANVIGTALVQYDGADGDATALDATGLSAISLNSNNALAGFQISARGDDTGQAIVVRVYSSATNFSTASITTPDQATPEAMFVPFSSFVVGGGTGADFNSVGAIELFIDGILDQNTTVSVVRSARPTIVTQNVINQQTLTVGNLVFRDINSDGTFNGSDVGVGGVDVQLYNDVNGNGTFESGTDTLSASTVTATSGTIGSYTFTGLSAGNYIVLIPATEFTTGQPLANHRSSVGAGPVDTNNEDQGAPSGAAGVAAAIVLASGTEPTTDGDSDNNTNLTVDFGFTNVDLVFTQTDSPDPIIVGQNITYTLTATNNGPSTANNIVITDVLPTGLTLVSANYVVNGGASQTANNASGTLTTNPFALNATQTTVMTIIATVGAGFVSGTQNTGSIDSDETDAATSSSTTTVTPNVDLGISKTIVGGGTTVGLGGTLTYRLTLTNNTSIAVTGIEVFDDLPTGFTPGTLPSGVATGTSPNDLIWSIASIPANQTVSVDIPVNVGTTAALGTATNSVTIDVSASGLAGFNDNTTGNNTATVNVTVEPRYDLLVTKDNAATSVATGQTVTYTISVNNSGPSAATNVVVTDALPAGLEFVSSTAGGATGQNFSATIASIASGATSTISLVARVRSSATGSIVNTVSVAADNPTQETPGRSNTATDTDSLTRNVVLNVTAVDSTDSIVAGGATFDYVVTVFNSGTADAPNVLLFDPIPSGLSFVSGTFAVNESTPRTGTVTFNTTTSRLEANLGTLLGGGTSTTNRALVTLTLRANADAPAGQVSSTFTASNADNTTGVTDTETTQVTRDFDLTVSVNDNATSVTQGQTITYTIVVTNTGSSTATNVVVTDILPSTVSFVSATSGFTNSSGTVTGTIASIPAGGTSTLTITTTVNNSAPNGTDINNTVTVAANGETTTTNNSGTATANILSTASISGFVYTDADKDGVRDSNEVGIANVTMTLTGTPNGSSSTITRTVTTDSTGAYSFLTLPLGTYSVTRSTSSSTTSTSSSSTGTHLILYTSTATNVGTINGTTVGSGTTTAISSINLTGDSVLNNFQFTPILTNRWYLTNTPSSFPRS